MAEVNQAVLPAHEEPSQAEVNCFNPCRDCKSQSYCRRHGCQNINAMAPVVWRCNPCNYGCTDYCLVNAIAPAEEITPKIMNLNCKCQVPIKWCQYPACGAESCIMFNCSKQFILIQETPAIATSTQTITCGTKCSRCGEAKTNVDGAWMCTNPLCR